MNATKPYNTGVSLGWEWSARFDIATRDQKRATLARLRRMSDSYNDLVEGIWKGIAERDDFLGHTKLAVVLERLV